MTKEADLARRRPWQSPHGKSEAIKGFRWASEPLKYPKSGGDTWSATWADDDDLYLVGDDTTGIDGSCSSNLAIFRVKGTPPDHAITTINPMAEYGKAGEKENLDTWKGAGLVCVDGVFYMGVGQHSGAIDYPDNIQQALDGSIVKSADHGQTWSPKPAAGKAMWPGPRFATPFFVQFGRDYQDAMDDYVYSVSNASTWNNGNYMILGRVPRTKIGDLNRDDWEFFCGADAQNVPTWKATHLGSHAYQAKAVFAHRGFTSMAGIQYLPATKRFLLAQWAYMDLDLPPEGDNPWFLKTMLCLYEAPKPWGPWRHIHTEENWGTGNYGPSIPSKWFADGGLSMWMIYAGCWTSPDYCFIARKLALSR
jgi:hypothetical protein